MVMNLVHRADVRPIIYVLSNLTFPAKEGQHVNHLLLIRMMRSAGHPVALIAFSRDHASLDVAELCDSVGGLVDVAILPTRLKYPLILLKHLVMPGHFCKLVGVLRQMLARLPNSIVHLEGIGLVPLVADLGAQATVVTTTDAWALRQWRLAARAGNWRLRAFLQCYALVSAWVERRYFPLAGAVQVVSPVDADYLKRAVPSAQIRSIPIALPSLPGPRPCVRNTGPGAPPMFLFWGDIGVAHIAEGLLWMLREVKPSVSMPARWVVLGRRAPSAAMQALAPGVQFITWVDDVDGFLQSADVVLLPDAAGTGLKNRAVHAMACGVPVVGTPAAFEGFPVVDEGNAMVKGEAASFANAVSRLVADPDLAERLALRGRQFAVDGYGVEAVGKQWADLYASVKPRGIAGR